jgi:hypothetical protein
MRTTLSVAAAGLVVISIIIAVAAHGQRDVISRDDDSDLVPNRVLSDLSIDNDITVDLVRHVGRFYEFALSDSKGGGGIELIAVQRSDGQFVRIWSGQDYPPCSAMDSAGVPTSLVERCEKQGMSYRGNVIEYMTSKLAVLFDEIIATYSGR